MLLFNLLIDEILLLGSDEHGIAVKLLCAPVEVNQLHLAEVGLDLGDDVVDVEVSAAGQLLEAAGRQLISLLRRLRFHQLRLDRLGVDSGSIET